MKTDRPIDDLSPPARALLAALRDESARDELAADPGVEILDEVATFANLTVTERHHLELAASGERGARRAIRAAFALPLER